MSDSTIAPPNPVKAAARYLRRGGAGLLIAALVLWVMFANTGALPSLVPSFLGAGLSNLAAASPSPTTALVYLRGAKDAKKVGTDSVAGVDTTHYRVTTDLQRAAARSSGSDKASVQEAMQLTGRKTLPMDAWVDGDGYLRKVAWAERTSAGDGAKVSMVLHDFGAPVKIEPPSGHVIDLLQRLTGGSG